MISQLAKILRDPNTGEATISVRTLRRWAENGEIPASKRNSGRWFVDLDELSKTYKELQDRVPNPYETAALNPEEFLDLEEMDDETTKH